MPQPSHPNPAILFITRDVFPSPPRAASTDCRRSLALSPDSRTLAISAARRGPALLGRRVR